MSLEFENSTLDVCETDDSLKEPSQYKVLFFNDDYTTKDFVVEVLETVFHKNLGEAVAIMEAVHKKGSSVVGVYSYDIAATRVMLTQRAAREQGFPLRCKLEQV